VIQIAIAIDQLANTLLGGTADETMSARAHRMRVKGHRYWGGLLRSSTACSSGTGITAFTPTRPSCCASSCRRNTSATDIDVLAPRIGL